MIIKMTLSGVCMLTNVRSGCSSVDGLSFLRFQESTAACVVIS